MPPVGNLVKLELESLSSHLPRLCLFCYKTVRRKPLSPKGHVTCEEDVSLIEKFLRLLKHFSREEPRSRKVPEHFLAVLREHYFLENLSVCETCTGLLTQFSNRYFQWKALSLKMESDLESLVGMIDLANRTPSKAKRLQAFLGHNVVPQAEKRRRLESVWNIRRSVVSRYKDHLFRTNLDPCVVLRRTDISSEPSTSPSSPTKDPVQFAILVTVHNAETEGQGVGMRKASPPPASTISSSPPPSPLNTDDNHMQTQIVCDEPSSSNTESDANQMQETEMKYSVPSPLSKLASSKCTVPSVISLESSEPAEPVNVPGISTIENLLDSEIEIKHPLPPLSPKMEAPESLEEDSLKKESTQKTKMYRCPCCPKMFKYCARLKRHASEKHPNATKLGVAFVKKWYPCKVCNINYVSEKRLRVHLKYSESHKYLSALQKKRQKTNAEVVGIETTPRADEPQTNQQQEQEPPSAEVTVQVAPTPTNSKAEVEEGEAKRENRYSLRGKRSRVSHVDLPTDDNDQCQAKDNDPDFQDVAGGDDNPHFSDDNDDNGSLSDSSHSAASEEEPATKQRKPFPKTQCKICQAFVTTGKLERHFQTQHDIEGMTPSNVVHCDVPGCAAFFKTFGHRFYHKRKVHKIGASVFESQPDDLSEDEATEEGYKCKTCGKTWKTSWGILNHKQGNVICGSGTIDSDITASAPPQGSDEEGFGHSAFICPFLECKRVLFSKYKLKAHERLHGNFTCKFCSTSIYFAPELALHELHEHGNSTSPSQCTRCSLTFEGDEDAFIQHFCKSHVDHVKVCPICKMKAGERAAEKHMKVFHDTEGVPPDQIFRCDLCPAWFLKSMQINQHKLVIHWKRKCPVCGFTTTAQHEPLGKLKEHIQRNHPEVMTHYPFVCTVEKCPWRFGTVKELESHVTGVHSQFKCEHCAKTFTRVANLNMHVKEVHGGINHICQECGKGFKSHATFTTHKKYHLDPSEWKHQCTICGRRFADRQKLTQHAGTHTKEKPFQCEHCGEKYAHRHNWRHHLKKKHGLTP